MHTTPNVILQARRVQAETVSMRLCPELPLRENILWKRTRPTSTWCATCVQYLRSGGQTDARESSSALRVQSTLQRPPCRSTPVSAALRTWTHHTDRLQLGKDSLNLCQLSSGDTCSVPPKPSATRTEPGPVYFTTHTLDCKVQMHAGMHAHSPSSVFIYVRAGVGSKTWTRSSVLAVSKSCTVALDQHSGMTAFQG